MELDVTDLKFSAVMLMYDAMFFTDALGAVLTSHLDKPRVYVGCMKSGEVFSEP